MLTRCNGWENILSTHIEKHLTLPQEWGKYDCCMFPCDWVLTCTGVDPAQDFRGKYKTKVGAYRAIKEFGGDLQGVAEKIARQLSMQETSASFGRRGDVALAPGDGGPALGIIDMTGRFIAVQGKEGLGFAPLTSALKVWRVG